MKKLSQLIAAALLSGAISLAAPPTPTMALTAGAKTIDSTGIYATAGQQFTITAVATGRVNIDPNEGGYVTDPNGTITFAPVPSSGTYAFFTSSLNPIGTAPAVGGQKFGNSTYGAYLNSAPLGALLSAWSPNPTPSQPSDFPNGFTLVGTSSTVTAPAGGGYLFLIVNDLIYYGSDNLGGFSVGINGPLSN